MMLLVLSACSSVQDNQQAKQTQTTTTSKTEEEKMVTATVNGETFTITLNQSQAAQEFLNLLPLTLDMRDVNGNENMRCSTKHSQTMIKKQERFTLVI